MAGPWFDTFEGKLVVGEAAYEQAVEQSFPGQIVPFRDALLDSEAPPWADGYEKADVDEWSRQDYVDFGKWVLGVINTGEEPDQPITVRLLKRLYILGFGPEERRYLRKSRFGSMETYRDETGSPQGRRKYNHAELTPDKFLKLTTPTRVSPGKIAVERYLDNLAARGHTAPSWIWRRHLGNFRPLLDQEGHPDTRNWETDDFLRWAADFIEVNGYERLAPLNVEIVAARHRAPWPRSIINQFNNKWRYFKEEAKKYFEEVRQPIIEARERRLKEYTEMISTGKLPDEFAQLAPTELLSAGSKFVLAQALLPQVPDDKIRQFADINSDKYIAELINHYERLDPGTVEATAVMLDIFDDIWPTFSFKEHLHLSEEEVSAARELHRHKVRYYTNRSRQQAS